MYLYLYNIIRRYEMDMARKLAEGLGLSQEELEEALCPGDPRAEMLLLRDGTSGPALISVKS
jgi:hypothetical protein